MVMSAPVAQARETIGRWLKSTQEVAHPDWRENRPSQWVVRGTSIGVVLMGIIIYARSIHVIPLGDDWLFLWFGSKGPATVFGIGGNYHYNPVGQGLQWLIYVFFGTNPVPFHIVSLALFCASTVLLLHIAWRVTGSFAAGALASVMYVLNGRQYEGVIWTVVSIFQTLGLFFFLAGMLFYLSVHDKGRSASSRRWQLAGFYACWVLAILTYEQEITLIVACALYRFFVLEHGRGFSRMELVQRGKEWAREFGFAVIFMVGYLAFKYFVGRASGNSQAPGLHAGINYLVVTIIIGLYQSYAPGIVNPALLPLQHRLYFGLIATPTLWKHVAHILLDVAPLAGIIVFAKPVYRWLALWSILTVSSTVLGIGYLASRYMLLFLVSASIMWAGFLVAMTKWIYGALERYVRQRRPSLRRVVPAVALVPAALIFAGFAALGLQYVFVEQANWQQASDIVTGVNRDIQHFVAENPQARTLYLADLPGSLPAPAGYFEHGAYMDWVGTNVMVELNNPHSALQSIETIRTRNDPYTANGKDATVAQVDAWSHQAGVLVLTYNYTAGHVTKWPTAP